MGRRLYAVPAQRCYAAHESHENTRFWPLGYRWFRRRFWTLSEPTGKLAWLELQPLLRTSFWKSKAHCANPASIGFGEWMPGLPCARGTTCRVLVGLNVAIHGQRYSQHWPRVRKQETSSTQTQPRRRRPVPSRPDSAAAVETATIVLLAYRRAGKPDR
jgi:hypothetical protein